MHNNELVLMSTKGLVNIQLIYQTLNLPFDTLIWSIKRGNKIELSS
jgi:hypothetical protein